MPGECDEEVVESGPDAEVVRPVGLAPRGIQRARENAWPPAKPDGGRAQAIRRDGPEVDGTADSSTGEVLGVRV